MGKIGLSLIVAASLWGASDQQIVEFVTANLKSTLNGARNQLNYSTSELRHSRNSKSLRTPRSGHG